jgi:hypothetical protein
MGGAAMIYAQIGFDGDSVEKAFDLLKDFSNGKGPERAMTHALNRTAVGARADIIRAIRETYEIRAGDVRNVIKIRKATFSSLEGRVESSGAVLPVEQFRHSPTGFAMPRPKVGVRLRARRDQPGVRIPGTFYIPGNPHIYRRTTDDPRSSLKRLFGPSIPSMMRVVLDDDEQQGIQDRAEQRLLRELEHEIDFMLSGRHPVKRNE